MRSIAHRCRTSLMLGLLALACAAGARAEDAAGNLNLRKTYLKSQGGLTVVQNSWADAFTPTTVLCPDESGSCVFRVEVSSVFEQVPAGSVAAVRVRIDGLSASPASWVEVDSTSADQYTNARTFTWMKTGIANGSHTVDVDFAMAGSGAAAYAGPRTLTIEVYKVPVIFGPVVP